MPARFRRVAVTLVGTLSSAPVAASGGEPFIEAAVVLGGIGGILAGALVGGRGRGHATWRTLGGVACCLFMLFALFFLYLIGGLSLHDIPDFVSAVLVYGLLGGVLPMLIMFAGSRALFARFVGGRRGQKQESGDAP